nr:leucine-rich repeat domain-containing protein [Lachnospiraceae bacterium]
MKKTVKKTVGAICLVLALALSQIPAPFAQAVGSQMEFKRDGDTLISYTGTASVVSVPDGIKNIGTDAFAGNRSIESVSFPSSVEVIENGAFRDCVNLDSVYFSSGLSSVESGAFAMCPELDTVCFSDTVMELGAGVFSGDDELKTIDLRKNTYFVLYDGALYNRDMTKLIQVFAGREGKHFDMPDTVADIERYAFWGCDNLESVELSSHLTEIPEYSFSNCKNLKTVSVPYSVRRIAAKAFEDCIDLDTITLPASVTNIHSTAFDGCYALKIVAQEGTPAYEFAQAFKASVALLMEKETTIVSENTIGDRYQEIVVDTEEDEEEDSGTTEILDVYDPTNPADVSKLNVSDYYGPDSADVIGKTRVVAGNAVVFYDENPVQPEQEEAVPEPEPEEFVADFTAEDDGSHNISKKKYYQSSAFKKLTMEHTIERIDDFAFARTSAEAVVIPDGVTQIGYGAFYHCDKLKQVKIPGSVKTIEPEAFSETKYLNKWLSQKGGEDFLVVGDGILLAYKGSEPKVHIPDEVKKIAGGAFKNHTEIQEVVLNDGLVEIGEDAFNGCTSLSAVSGGQNVEKICDRAFATCPLTKVAVGKNVSEIGLGAYKLVTSDAVVFAHDKTLPKVSYEKTATRLENDSYRSLAFPDIKTAVVSGEFTDIENSILDEAYLGFRGLVVTISDAALKQAKLVYCTMNPDELSGLVEVPSYVRVNGENYSVTSAKQDAFDAYETADLWCDGKVKGILLPPNLGKLSDYDTTFPFDTTFSLEEEEKTDETKTEQESKAEQTTTIVHGSSYPDADKLKAEVLDDEERYVVYVGSDPVSEQELIQAVSAEYGSPVDGQLQVLDLKMLEAKSNVLISNFGDTTVEIRIPISETIAQQNICVVTIGENGSLQTIYGTKQKSEGQNYFVFRTNHFSAYGIYAGIGEIGEKIKAESQRLLQKDASPETGDRFDPKWLLVAAFVLAGLALLIQPIRRNNL